MPVIIPRTKRINRKRPPKPPQVISSVTLSSDSCKEPKICPTKNLVPSVNQSNSEWYEPSVARNERVKPPPSPAHCNRIPKITLHGIKTLEPLVNLLLKKMGKDDFIFSSKSSSSSLQLKELDHFVYTINELDNLGVQYHYKNTLADKFECYVVRGIPAGFDNLISDSLKERGFVVHDVRQLMSQRTSSVPTNPVYALTHAPLANGPRLTEVRVIRNWLVKIELYKGTNREPMLCFRCCRFDHTATFCTLNPRCFKCAGQHEGSACKLTREEPFKCCNCDRNHLASFRGCPSYIAKKQRNMQAKRKQDGVPITAPTGFIAQSVSKPASQSQKKEKKKDEQKSKSLIVVTLNANGNEVENIPGLFDYLDTHGAHLACIYGLKRILHAVHEVNGWSLVANVNRCGKKGRHGHSVTAIMIRSGISHSKHLEINLQHLNATLVRIETKSGAFRIAVAHSDLNDPFLPADISSLFQGEDPTIVSGDMNARHRAWDSSINNRRGKILHRISETDSFDVYGLKNPDQYIKEDSSPSVMLIKNLSCCLSLSAKPIESNPTHPHPLILHLKGIQRPKVPKVKKMILTEELQVLISMKNLIRRQWQKTRNRKFKESLRKLREVIKIELAAYRRKCKEEGQLDALSFG